MTIDSLFSEVMKWGKRIVAVTFLLVLAITGVELLNFNVPSISGLSLTQPVGIALAGIGYLLRSL